MITLSVVLSVARPSLANAPTPSPSPESVYIVAINTIPTATPKPKAKPRTKVLSVHAAEVQGYIQEVWGANAARAMKVAECESGFDPFVVNDNPATGDYSVGIFQINLFGKLAKNRPSEAWLKDYKNNIEYAHKMFLASGWYPTWTCAK